MVSQVWHKEVMAFEVKEQGEAGCGVVAAVLMS